MTLLPLALTASSGPCRLSTGWGVTMSSRAPFLRLRHRRGSHRAAAAILAGKPKRRWAAALTALALTLAGAWWAAAPAASAAHITFSVSATISVGARPEGVAVDPATGTIYVANQNSDTVSVINGATNTVTATIAVGSTPFAVAVDPTTDTAYVANIGSDTVSVINGATNTVTATIAVGSAPFGVAADPATGTVYVANEGSNTVSVISGATHAVTATIAVGTAPYAVAVDPTTDTAYVANLSSNTVSVISGATHTVTATVAVGNGPDSVAVDPATDTAYTANEGDGSVSVISGATSTVTATIHLGTFASGVAVDPNTDTVFVTNVAAPTVSVIDEATNTVTGSISVGTDPHAVAVDPNTDTAYVANFGSNTVSVLSPEAPSGLLLVSPSPAPPGAHVRITGGGFQPGELVHWFIGTATPLVTGTAVTNPAGVFTATVTIPLSAPAFTYLVSAVGASSHVILVSSLKVTGGASLVVNPPTGPPGTQVTITGSGFQALESVRWSIGMGTPLVSGTATASQAGVFAATTTIPLGAVPWSYLVTASGTSNDTLGTSFVVTAPSGPSLVVNPPSGPPGTQVKITGTGFQPQASVNWSIGTATPMVSGTAYTNTAGVFTATTTIPFGAAPWTYIVSAVHSSFGVFQEMVTNFVVTGPASQTFTIVSADSGPGASEISVADPTGFNIGDSVAIGLGGTDAEVRTITGFGSLKFDKPLLFAHQAGEPVVLLPNPVADTMPPTTVANLSVSPNASGWINQNPVGVTLLAQDEPGGAGVVRTYYALDDSTCAPPTTGSAIPAACQTGNSLTVSGDGQHTLYFFSVDAAGNFEAQQHLAVNIDTTAPTVACRATPATLWPPNGELVGVTVTVTVADAGSGPAGFTLLRVTTNEGDIAAEMAGFAVGTSSTQGQLRAARDGSGSGRVYTLTYQGSDQAGNTAVCSTTVVVPHDQGQ